MTSETEAAKQVLKDSIIKYRAGAPRGRRSGVRPAVKYTCADCRKRGRFIGRGVPERPVCVVCFRKREADANAAPPDQR